MKFLKDMIAKNGEAPVVPPKAKVQRTVRPQAASDAAELAAGLKRASVPELKASQFPQEVAPVSEKRTPAAPAQALAQPLVEDEHLSPSDVLRLSSEQVRVPASDPTAPAASAPNRRPKTKLVQMPGTRVPAADPDSPVPPQRNPVRLKKKIWDLENEGDEEAAVQAEPAMEPRAKKPRVPLRAPAEGGPNIAPPAGRPARGGRVKTRLIGFAHSDGATEDPFAKEKSSAQTTQALFPAGWLLLVDGPGRGNCFTLFTGVAQIGRGDDQQIRLDFGDSAISRQNHAAVAYDPEQRKFFLGHGGKSNLVRLNGKPVLSTEDLSDGDLIRIGETTLRFVALCGEHFTWDDADDEAQDDE